ncbi:NADPH-dependent FMN reductase [Undibacterium flavidum]|uniref:NAD(P)H-dependent oxidoreductase n=1 Tax=Undibacterium flavidum TaxID=2762297 RepID=A0ABR6YDR6_9BURK|nr:NADPH-dependent FMN reductase [Undibacterium flavidum]MBC3874703.1 NAD(P)H-dependent oxidoreductase [Undibacterium flavidum]
MKILALCGSLRKQSRSLALLQATANLAGNQFDFSIFDGLGDLPLFNPDIEASASVPPTVHRLWEAVNWSDAIIIASPEYAHGVTGTIKNALDWLVAYVPFTNKPVAAFNPSHRASIADEALREILSTMNAHLITAACLRIPVTNCQLSAEDIASSDSHKEQILTALTAISAIFEHK